MELGAEGGFQGQRGGYKDKRVVNKGNCGSKFREKEGEFRGQQCRLVSLPKRKTSLLKQVLNPGFLGVSSRICSAVARARSQS